MSSKSARAMVMGPGTGKNIVSSSMYFLVEDNSYCIQKKVFCQYGNPSEHEYARRGLGKKITQSSSPPSSSSS
jgi:hypothetical protein